MMGHLYLIKIWWMRCFILFNVSFLSVCIGNFFFSVFYMHMHLAHDHMHSCLLSKLCYEFFWEKLCCLLLLTFHLFILLLVCLYISWNNVWFLWILTSIWSWFDENFCWLKVGKKKQLNIWNANLWLLLRHPFWKIHIPTELLNILFP